MMKMTMLIKRLNKTPKNKQNKVLFLVQFCVAVVVVDVAVCVTCLSL